VRFEPAAPGEVAELVRARQATLTAEGRRLLVYVGASWCEPCKVIHAAAERGELDTVFPGLTLLEFDADRDEARLRLAGYDSELVPLFALPGPDGRASGRATHGAKKGNDFVADLRPRIAALLAD
jgi:thiol-disulfide isomerase/thioredoxin